MGLIPNAFHLSNKCVLMKENSTLTKYDIKDGDTVLLIPASTAG